MRGKRGDIELQFNWMFVFIVGTIILATAAGFVIKQKNDSDILISGQIIRFTRSVLTISSATPGKAEPQPLQKEIGVSCDPKGCSAQGCTSDFYVMPRDLNAKIDTKVAVIFSPTLIKGDTLGTWSQEWDRPYHINNFLYTTSNIARYIFVEGTDPAANALIDELYTEMPEIMGKKEKISSDDVSTIKDRNNYKVKFIYINQEPENPPLALSAMKAADLTAVQIITEPGNGLDIGTLKFYKKSGLGFTEQTPSDTAYYLGKPTVYGAIFSESKETYTCNMYKALLRLKTVSELYDLKLDTLMSSNDISSVCKSIYSEAKTSIDYLKLDHTIDDAPTIKEKSDSISNNNHALKLKSCPTIY